LQSFACDRFEAYESAATFNGEAEIMMYEDGSAVSLGDIIEIDMPDGTEVAKVVMLGDTLAHLDIDAGFREWVVEENILGKDQVVVEWVNANPLAHNDPSYAPVGDYMTTGLDGCVRISV
jgi:hypothetical protein